MDESSHETTSDTPSSRNFLHEDQALCKQLLHTIAVTVPLQILPSKIPGAGTGLFVAKDTEAGEEISRSEPLVKCVDDGKQSVVCDTCYKNHDSTVNPVGRFRTLEDPNPIMKACSGCKVCYYCSRVSNNTICSSIYQSSAYGGYVGLPEDCLEKLPQA
jgi:hypothetical protein